MDQKANKSFGDANQKSLHEEDNESLAEALLKANKELAFQNEEKEKRATELTLLNQELAYQIAEKEKKTAELEAAVAELESFTYSVSHDLRAPLRAINGFTQVLVEDYLDQLDDEAEVVMDEIIGNAKKMGQLIDSLLEFSRLAKRSTSMADVNMSELVKQVLDELRQLEPEREIEVRVQDLPQVKGDWLMLKQVIFNLVSNAFKYTGRKEHAVVEIGAFAEKGFQTYFVKDNGAGFNMKYYDKLFGVFQRLHSSNEFEGHGVGLAIIQKVVTNHGGRVWAEGKVNEGACFYISLPAVEQ